MIRISHSKSEIRSTRKLLTVFSYRDNKGKYGAITIDVECNLSNIILCGKPQNYMFRRLVAGKSLL